MTVLSLNKSFILFFVLHSVQGSLEPDGMVSVDCGSTQTFTCRTPDPIGWNIAGLSGINTPGPFLARILHNRDLNDRFTSPDSGGTSQIGLSVIIISGFSASDNGGIIQCVNMDDNSTRGMVTISVDINVPTDLSVVVDSCDTVSLQWGQPSEPNDITTSVSCTPPSPGCAECTTSPCTITDLNPSTEYQFTVTLNSNVCGTSRNMTEAFKIDASSCSASNSTSNDTSPDTPVSTSPGPLAALAVLVLLIPLIYPLGVLIARVCCFRDKSYCEVFWCCGCCRKDKSPRCNSTELMTSPHPREEEQLQNGSNEKHIIQFVTDGEKNKDQSENKQEHVVTHETVEQLGDDDGDVITDETVEQQGYEDWIAYATLDFSGNGKGNINVVHSITDEVTYAAV